MPINPQHAGSFSILDNSNEISRMSFFFGPITALTLPGPTGFLALYGAFRSATQALILGNIIQDQWSGDITQYAKTVPSDVNAQRERKASVTYEDTTTHALYRIEVPTVNLAGRVQPLSDLIDLTESVVAAWVTGFEALCLSPEGHAINVLQIRAVGRSI